MDRPRTLGRRLDRRAVRDGKRERAPGARLLRRAHVAPCRATHRVARRRRRDRGGKRRHEPGIEHYLDADRALSRDQRGRPFGGFQRPRAGVCCGLAGPVFGGALALFVTATAASFDRTLVHGMMGSWTSAPATGADRRDAPSRSRPRSAPIPGPLLSLLARQRARQRYACDAGLRESVLRASWLPEGYGRRAAPPPHERG